MISSETAFNTYTGDNTTDSYNFDFPVQSKNDLRVVEADADGVESVLTVDVDYTVSGVGDAEGGSITLTAGNLATDHKLMIRVYPSLKQESDIRNQGGFFPETHEDIFDRIVQIAQRLDFENDRALRVSDTITGFDPELPDLEADKFLRVNSAGTGITTGDPGSVVLVTPGVGTVIETSIVDGAITTNKHEDHNVTYIKIQQVTATDRILGRESAGAGVIEEIVCTAAGRALLDDADAATQRTTLGLGTAATANTGTTTGTVPLVGTSSSTTSLAGLVELATDAEAKAATDAARAPSIESLNHHPGVAKAWVIFKGSDATIMDSYGVDSVVRNSTGDYTITFTTAFASQEYVVTGSGEKTAGGADPVVSIANGGQSSGASVRVRTFNLANTAVDPVRVHIMAFGHQI